MQEALGGLFPFNQFEDMSKQNMAMFEQAMKFFTPTPSAGSTASTSETPQASSRAAQPDAGDMAIDALKDQVDLLQKQLNELSRKTT
jgi:polyhydroxyalkanoate synthesis regulator protein